MQGDFQDKGPIYSRFLQGLTVFQEKVKSVMTQPFSEGTQLWVTLGQETNHSIACRVGGIITVTGGV